MFLLLAASIAMAPAAESAPPATVDEVVIMGERMRRLKLVTKTDRKTGVQRCVMKRSSGDAAFDARMCTAVITCAPTVRTGTQMEACMRPHIVSYARELEGRSNAIKGDTPR